MKDTGFVDGNTEDKYNAKNPISKILVQGFFDSFSRLLARVPERTDIIEIGAGEGVLTAKIADTFPHARVIACDLSERQNELARQNLASYGRRIRVQKEDAENLSLADASVDFVVCCEVLEHVEKPAQALSEISRILKNDGYALMSVPWEPLWRVLNLARLKYVTDFGNTPGHLNHFSRAKFVSMIRSAGLDVIAQDHPLPWSMVLVQKRS